MKKLLVVLVVSLFCCMSCGGDDCPTCPGSPRPSGSPPVISDLQCNPSSADIGQSGGVLTIGCSVDFIDPDEDFETILEKVLFSAQDCGKDPLSDISIDVRSQAAGQQQGTINFGARVQTDCVEGIYRYEISALDSENSEPNTPLGFSFELVEPDVP